MKNILRQALQFAQTKHKGQKYDNKEFIVHPLMVVGILESIVPNDINLICAGYLHDILEDTTVSYKRLKGLFGEDIASLVKEVTKTGYNEFPNLKTRRGVILKFADRLSNLTCMDSWDEEKQQKYILKSKFWK